MRAKGIRRFAWLVLVILAGTIVWAFVIGSDRRGPQTATEIFEGVTYGSDRLELTDEGSGLVHWVRIDLTRPGIELYVTPMDQSALAEGWQYRLRRTHDVVDRERLSVAINGTLFTSKSSWLRMPGALAKGVEIVVSDHVVSHFWEHTYLLWFDDHLRPHLKPSKPPTAEELSAAKWGVGGQGVGLYDGKIWPGSDRTPNSRTGIAIDQQREILFLAVGEYISPRRLLEKFASLGAKAGMLLDGGGSTSMVVGQGAQGIRPGILHGGGRPVATHFGIRAQRVRAALRQ